MGDLDTKVAEYKQKAEKCDLPTTRTPAMDAYVFDDLKADGTRSSGTRVMTAKQASCMGVPGSNAEADQPSAAAKLWGKLTNQFSAAKEAVGTSLEDLKAAPAQAAEGWKVFSGTNKTEKTMKDMNL